MEHYARVAHLFEYMRKRLSLTNQLTIIFS